VADNLRKVHSETTIDTENYAGSNPALTTKTNNMENIELENKELKAPKVTKKQKEFVSEETIATFEEILKDYAIDLKYRPFIKQLVNEYRKNG
jgi:hypothetical protein